VRHTTKLVLAALAALALLVLAVIAFGMLASDVLGRA
jgi:hypothetical protein